MPANTTKKSARQQKCNTVRFAYCVLNGSLYAYHGLQGDEWVGMRVRVLAHAYPAHCWKPQAEETTQQTTEAENPAASNVPQPEALHLKERPEGSEQRSEEHT